MTLINVNYAAMSAGHDGLVATWGRIESHLASLDAVVAATGDLRSDAVTAYAELKQRWDLAADDRQLVLRSLASSVADAVEQYRAADTALAALFAV